MKDEQARERLRVVERILQINPTCNYITPSAPYSVYTGWTQRVESKSLNELSTYLFQLADLLGYELCPGKGPHFTPKQGQKK